MKMKVTVYLSTYNQEAYVAQAMDSILMQKTDFSYELLVADDCSTDGTQRIVLEYQKRYPDKIRTYFTPVNVGGCKKLTDCIDKGLLTGEYIALLEGDDYWLGEDRLQVLVDFLDQNPKYSRVSHQRKIIDENDQFIGYDVAADTLNKDFSIRDFLAGKDYPDFASVFRNYYLSVGSKYNALLLASRNVCDFQDMFITQDFGPVYVMDKCLSVYRSRSVSGASNYNSITSQSQRCIDHIHICRAVEQFYHGRYDLSPIIHEKQKRLLGESVRLRDAVSFERAKKYVEESVYREIMSELAYLAWRGNRYEELEFIFSGFDGARAVILSLTIQFGIKRVCNKLLRKKRDNNLKGYVVAAKANEDNT